MKKVEHKNILLIGRTRTGKSTIKSLLVNPANVPNDMTLKSGTRDPQFQAFHLQKDDVILNIIDTPGLFEHSNNEIDIRDNDMILKTIGFCINMEIAKFHAICFVVSLTAGINQEDIMALELLIDYFGPEASNNSCLIITHCETTGETQRNKLKKELMEDSHFKKVAPFFKLGVFFSGSLNRDDCDRGLESVYHQYNAVSVYREILIELFLKIGTPIPIDKMAATSRKFADTYRIISSSQDTKPRSYNTLNRSNRYYND
jgi:GTP-binding protein EngB required for normal cell division